MHNSLSTPLFAICRQEPDDHLGFLVVNPSTGELCSDRTFKDGYCCMPLTMDEDQAEALARRLQEQAPQPSEHGWRTVPAPAPCAKCGRIIWANDLDFCYPENREGTSWRAGCNTHDFGCGHEVVAESKDAVMQAWNTRGKRN